jgi:outer membrane protein assembly factor BamB
MQYPASAPHLVWHPWIKKSQGGSQIKTRTFLVILSTLIYIMCTVSGIADEYDWPRWRGPNGDGISLETDWDPKALAGGPKILWKVDVGMGYSNVVIKDNRLYTMGRKSSESIVFCLNAETGEEIWQYSFENVQDPQSTPTIEGKYIYALGKEGILLCLKAKNGKRRWVKDLVNEYAARAPYYGFAGSPVVAGELVVLTANSAGMALNKYTGELVWRSSPPPKERYPDNSTGIDYSTPVIYVRGDKQYAIVSGYNGVSSVDVETGDQLWLYDWGKQPYTIGNQIADPLLFGEKLFVVEYYSQHPGSFLIDIGGNDIPKLMWVNRESCSNNGSPVAIDGYIYVCQDGIQSGFGSLRCLDAKNGEILWEQALEGNPITLSASEGKLIILDSQGRLFIAEASPYEYKEISSCDVLEGERKLRQFWTPPVLYKGKIYCRNYAGDLICIDVSK